MTVAGLKVVAVEIGEVRNSCIYLEVEVTGSFLRKCLVVLLLSQLGSSQAEAGQEDTVLKIRSISG